MDLLSEDSDSLVITDIKTSRGKWSAEQVEDSGEQLLLYSHLASEIAHGKKIATRFLVLTKTKAPVVAEHVREVKPTPVKRTLAGDRERRVLSITQHDELHFMRLSGGVPGVGGVKPFQRDRPGRNSQCSHGTHRRGAGC